MKILHIAPNAPYNDYWGYQDNLLPKYHRKLGHDVTIIVTNTMYQDGRIIETDCADYVLNDGVRVIRLKKREYPHRILTSLNSRLNVLPYLNEIRPDFVFFHGLVSITIFDVVQYKKENPECVVVQDSHLDYFNFRQSDKVWKSRLIQSFYRHIWRKTASYISRVYGVTPWRKTFAEDYFGVSQEKTDVLIMGADDEKIDFEQKSEIRARIREMYHIEPNDFLIVTGGKIDRQKNIHLLMEACRALDGVKLLVFGAPSSDIADEFNRRCSESSNIVCAGWIDAEKVYEYFMAADLICFPGTHSVLWEQACASKVPCLFKHWEGMEHVNNGGNSEFILEVTVENIRHMIRQLLFTDKYFEMKLCAESEKTDVFLYSNIAQKSLECIKQ